MSGEGDIPRNCFSEQYRDNYDAIFRRKPRQPHLNLGITASRPARGRKKL